MNWNSHEFIWLDWVIIVVGIVAVGWAVWRSVQKDKKSQDGANSEDYLFGKGEPWYIIGAAIFAANIGSEHLVGLAGTGAKSGVGMAHWEMQGWMILLLGWLFVPFYQLMNNKMGKIITMPDFLKYRYTPKTGSWLSIITLIAYVLTKVSVTAFTGGIFMESLLGIPFWYGAIGLILLTGVFTVLGGMKGVMTLSAIQTPILIIGSFMVLFLGLSALGNGSIGEGWTAMIEFAKTQNVGADGVAYGTNHMFHLQTGDPMYDDYPGFWVFLGASIIGFWYWCTDQHIVQRVLGQQKGEANDVVMARARRGTVAAGYFKLLPVFMFLIPGMIAAALAARPDSGFVLSDPDTAFGSMVKFVLPAGVKGIVTIGFISALVASLAAFFNSCATLFTEDFYKPMYKDKSEATYVMVGRVATMGVVVLGIVWIPVMKSLGSLYDYLQGIQSLLAPAMVAVFALGIFSKKISPKSGEVGMIVGFILGMVRLLTNIFTNSGKDVMTGTFWESTTWFWQTNWLIFEIWLLVFIIVLMIVVSMFTPKPTAQQIDAITFTGDYKELIRKSWNVWDVVASLGVVVLCGLFYWYFW
ncbi:sodium:solute symporter [Epilithonimonas hispanica]|uniref:SSS family transporter n=1 Tax=Epilithonimonas hispanica TaxID=358687 RepID=A0A3D9D425_9FLAO|nr:sodium:solute symporter [Epilithonimonas hispanica]REC72750.1 SSS family transporter [Epilithonimonas hispanica]